MRCKNTIRRMEKKFIKINRRREKEIRIRKKQKRRRKKLENKDAGEKKRKC